jgi:ABC-type transport system substrate-binding protein
LDTLPDAKAYTADSRLKTAFNNFFWEWDRGIFQDVRARRAILHSIDREAATFAGYEGLAGTNPTNSFFPPGGPFTNPDLKEFEYDPAEAKKLWDEIFAEYGQQKISFIYTAISAEFRPMSLVHKQNMADAGVTDLDIRLISIQDYLDEMALGGRTPTWRTENAMAPNISFRTTEPADTLTSWQCGRHWSSHYCNEELDEYINEGLAGVDFAARQEAYFKYQVKAQEVIPSFVCCWRAVGHGVGKRLHGLLSHFGDFNYDRAWIKQ